jgi:hypothetical protein
MILFGLLLLPVLIGLAARVFGKGAMTWREWIIHELTLIALISTGYFYALHLSVTDTEIWSGVVVSKDRVLTRCCHSYKCNCHESCNGSGTKRSCHEVCSTCYRHSEDIAWEARSSNAELVYRDGCNNPGTATPARWTGIRIGEPTAHEHEFVNYIKGNPTPLGLLTGASARYPGLIPEYPRVYDHYRADRAIAVGLAPPDLASLNTELAHINGELGATRQVNIILILVGSGDPKWMEGLREAWLGGKKNDLTVVVGFATFPRIAWTDVLSWTRNEDIRPKVRNRIRALENWDGTSALKIIEEEVKTRFERRPMAEFEYLKDTLEPPNWMIAFLFVLGTLSSLGLSYLFLQNRARDIS